MGKITIAAISLLLCASATAETTYYQCTGERGTTVFSDQPCGDDAQAHTVSGPERTGGHRVDAATWARVSAGNAAREAGRAIKEAGRAVERSEDRADQIAHERETKIGALQQRGCYASSDLACALYRESLATEMQAVTSQYQSKLDREYREQDQIRAQIQRTREAR